MKVVITGGAGFIGGRLTSALLHHHNAEVFWFDSFITCSLADRQLQPNSYDIQEVSSTSESLKSKTVGVIKADIRNFEEMQRRVSSADFIIHLAANTGVQPSFMDPLMDLSVNITGTYNILRLSKELGVRRTVLASSAAPMGASTDLPFHEGSLPKPTSPYGASKLAAESYASVFNQTLGLDVTALRFSNIYGPGCENKGSVVSAMIKQGVREGQVVINGNGLQTRDLLYVDDLVQMIIATLLSKRPKLNSLYQLGTGQETAILRLAELVSDELESQLGKKVSITYAAPLLGDVARNFADVKKFECEIERIEKTNLVTGIERTVNYLKDLL